MNFLSNLRLSFTQWGLLSLALAFGGLIVAFRARGTALHQAQISLLILTTRQADSGKEVAVQVAKEKLAKAMKDYYDAQQ